MPLRRLLPVAALAAAAIAAACAADAPPADIAASVAPLATVVERVAGPSTSVAVAIPSGVTAETYDPPPRRLARLRGASLVMRVGDPALVFEERVLRAVDAEARIVDLAALAAERGVERGEDPHLWLSPPLLAAAGDAVAEVLSKQTPADASAFAERAAAWSAEVDATDAAVRATLDASPCRTFLVDHPAWGSFAAHFGLRQLALEDHGKEPGPATLERTLAEAREAGIRLVIALPGPRRAAVDAVARRLGADVEVIDPLEADVLGNLRRMGELVARSCEARGVEGAE